MNSETDSDAENNVALLLRQVQSGDYSALKKQRNTDLEKELKQELELSNRISTGEVTENKELQVENNMKRKGRATPLRIQPAREAKRKESIDGFFVYKFEEDFDSPPPAKKPRMDSMSSHKSIAGKRNHVAPNVKGQTVDKKKHVSSNVKGQTVATKGHSIPKKSSPLKKGSSNKSPRGLFGSSPGCPTRKKKKKKFSQ